VSDTTAPRRGRFITLEGGEGAGKSTQQRRLVERLTAQGHAVLATREPGGSPRAEQMRDALLSGAVAHLGSFAEALLFCAARVDHLDITIKPALARGDFVVCDRFADSTRAYQGVLGRVPQAAILTLERVVVGDAMPDLTLILDLPPEIGLARAAARRAPGQAADRFEAETLEFHEGLRAAFLAIAAAEQKRCVVIDASAPPDVVAQAIWHSVEDRLLKPTSPRATTRA
jgi:dTMP kinase